MRTRNAVAAACCALGAVLPVTATSAVVANGQPTIHEHFEDAGVDPDFCGTGQDVEFEGRGRITAWIGETGGDPEQVLRSTLTFRFVLTNPATGAQVVDSGAVSETNVIVSGLESGPHTHEQLVRGLPSKLRAVGGGGVLVRDAGNVLFRVSLDEDDEFVDLEIVDMAGPHPGLESDAWCDAAIGFLGLD